MRIATWNVNSLKVRLPQVLDWLEQQQPDVLALQELKLDQPAFPLAEITAAGYHAVWAGQKTYNGVALLSKLPCENAVAGIPDYDDPQRRVIAATIAGVRVINVYCVNGESLDSDKYHYKLHWFSQLSRYIAAELQTYPQLVLLGDFNIAPDERDVYDAEKWRDCVLCSPAERAAFQQLLDLGLHDSFRLFQAEAGHYSWWDYRAAMFRRNLGLRIDHILLSDALRPYALSCEIDRQPRKNERPSDHTPVMLSLNYPQN